MHQLSLPGPTIPKLLCQKLAPISSSSLPLMTRFESPSQGPKTRQRLFPDIPAVPYCGRANEAPLLDQQVFLVE